MTLLGSVWSLAMVFRVMLAVVVASSSCHCRRPPVADTATQPLQSAVVTDRFGRVVICMRLTSVAETAKRRSKGAPFGNLGGNDG